jgi:drug/metabolite transporter (DMT)-like permease
VRQPPNRFALPALLLGAAAIALAPIFVRLSEVGPSTTAFYRLFLALPPLWLAVVLFDRQGSNTKSAPQPRRWLPWLALSGFCFAADLATWHWSIALTTVSSSTLLANFAPIWVTLGAWLLLGERISGRFVAGLAIAIGGVVLVMGVNLGGDDDRLLGDALAMVAGLFYGGYLLVTKFVRAALSTAAVMLHSALASSAFLLIVALASETTPFPASLEGWLVLGALALVSHVGGQGLIAYALAHLPVSFSSVTLLLQPVLATGLAWLVLAESIGGLQIIGSIGVLLGIFVARRGSEPRP